MPKGRARGKASIKIKKAPIARTSMTTGDDEYIPSDDSDDLGAVTTSQVVAGTRAGRGGTRNRKRKRSPTVFEIVSHPESDGTPGPDNVYEMHSFIDDSSIRGGPPESEKSVAQETLPPLLSVKPAPAQEVLRIAVSEGEDVPAGKDEERLSGLRPAVDVNPVQVHNGGGGGSDDAEGERRRHNPFLPPLAQPPSSSVASSAQVDADLALTTAPSLSPAPTADPLSAAIPAPTLSPPPSTAPLVPLLTIPKADFRQVIEEVLPTLQSHDCPTVQRAANLISSMSLVVRYDMQLRLHTATQYETERSQSLARMTLLEAQTASLQKDNLRLIGDFKRLNASTKNDHQIMTSTIKRLEVQQEQLQAGSESTRVYASQVLQQLNAERKKAQDADSKAKAEQDLPTAEISRLKRKVEQHEADLKYWTGRNHSVSNRSRPGDRISPPPAEHLVVWKYIS